MGVTFPFKGKDGMGMGRARTTNGCRHVSHLHDFTPAFTEFSWFGDPGGSPLHPHDPHRRSPTIFDSIQPGPVPASRHPAGLHELDDPLGFHGRDTARTR